MTCCAAGFLVAVAALLALPLQVQAQTTLVSNTGQTASSNWTVGGSSDWVHAQGFTTGDDADGYTLFSVQVRFGLGSVAVDAVRVSIYGADESGNPSSSLYELTNPSSIVASGLNTFTAPTRPTLEKETEYFIVVDATTGSFFVSSTLSDAEDDGAASGWSINDDRHRFSSGSWSLFTTALPIAVMGTIGAPTPVTIEAQHDSIGGGLEDLLFTLTREGETTDELDVTVTITQEQSWLSNLDFTVTFTAGSATATLPIGASDFSFTPSTTGDLTARVSGDGIDGGSETVKIISTSGPPITISYEESAYTFAEEATDEAVYALATLDAAYPRGYGLSRVLSVAFSSRTGTAESPEDYAAISWNAILFGRDFERAADTDPLVAREAVPDFAIVNDDIYEGSESFVMYIEAAPGLTAGLVQFADPDGNTCTGTSCAPEYPVTITDEEDLPELSLSVDPSSIAEEDDDGTTSVAENVSTVTVEITNAKTYAEDQTVTLTFSGDATRGIHYSVLPVDADTNTAGHQVVLVKETASVEVTVTATGNDTADGPRTVTVAAYLDGTAIGSSKDITIRDDETTTTLSTDATLSALTVNDGTTDHTIDLATPPYTLNVGNAVTTVTLTATPTHTGASVSAVTLGGTAIADADFTDGITVPSLIEGDNVIDVTVMAEDGSTESYMVTVTRAATTDTPVTIEAEYESIGAGLEDLLFTLTREGETTEALDVKVTIDQDQSWLSNIEYTVTFSANSATAELTITKSNFSFTPSTAGNLTATVSGDDIDGGSDTVQIISTSEPPFTASYDMPAYTFAEDATDKAIYLVVTLDAAYPRAVAIDAGSFSSRSGTATSPEDFATYSNQHVVSPGEFTRDVDTDPLVARSLIPDFILPDDIYEGSESFGMKIEAGPGLSADLLQFAYPDGTTCAPYSCSPGVEYPVTITDEGDLPALLLSVDPSSIAEEDDDGTTVVSENVSTVTVRITNGKTFAEDQTVTLTFSGDATQDTHYSVLPADADPDAAGHQVDLMVGKTAQVTVTATGNDTDDGPRTVTVAAYLDGTAIGSSTITILDDETTTTTAPAIVTDGVKVTSTPATGDTYGLGETIEITVTFDNAVTVDTSGGTPRIELLLGSGNKWAEYSSGSGGTALEFTYDVQSGDMDADGISIEADRLQLRGGTITAAADNTVNAFVYYDALGTQTEHKVNGSTVPGAPTSLTATASGTSTIDLSWTAPSSDGGSAITGYRIEVSSDGGSSWISLVVDTDDTNTTYEDRLPAGTTRHYRVSAINANGTGTASNVDDATTTTTVPGAPTSLTATASGTTAIDLSWTAPSSDGGSAITGYRIEVSSDGGSSWNDREANTGSTTTTYSHTGLSAGTTRHYRVSAINANGTGTASNVDNATTTTTVPGAPTGLTATASGTSTIDLDWTAPADDGGASITGYWIEVSSDGGSSWISLVVDTDDTNTTYEDRLPAGSTRHYRVSAINANGTGAASNVDDATTDDAATVPGAPTSLTATASGSNRIDLDWTAPSDNGGASISGYRIEVSPNGSSGWSNRETNTGNTSTGYSHTGLSAGTTRYYRVSAINTNGTGNPSNIDDATTDAAATTVPGAPTGLSATASGTTTINLTWNAPSDNGGTSITGYRIEVSSDGGSNWTDLVANRNSTSYSHTGLSPSTTRHYRVSAINSVGTGTASNVDDATTDDATTTVPGAPTGLSATPSGTSTINLTWNAPSNNGGASITGYRIEVSPNGSSGWTELVANTNSTSTSYAHTGLDAGTTRHYRVSAINSVGTGAPSSTANATTDDDDQPGLAVVTVHALETSVPAGGVARFELRRTGGDMGWLKVSYRHDESDGNYVRSWGYFKPGVEVKGADYDVGGSSGRVTARVTGPSNPLCTERDPPSASCTDNYTVGNPSSASMRVTASASASADALEDALTLVDGLTPDVAAAVLLGEQTLGEAELAALDRLGNGNGRYDLGDLLSWIDRCRRGEAHCGRTSTDSGPAAGALLGGAAAGGRSTPRRPGRRGSGRRGRKPTRTARRRGRFAGYALATLFAATLTLSCTEGSVGPAAYVPDPGFLTVEWSGPAAHRDVGVLLEFEGPTIDAVRAPGFELYESNSPGPQRIVVAGSLRPGPFVEFRVPDRNRFALYRVRVVEVTGEGYGLRDPTEYRAAVVMN